MLAIYAFDLVAAGIPYATLYEASDTTINIWIGLMLVRQEQRVQEQKHQEAMARHRSGGF